MPASNHTLLGTVAAIQYTGTNGPDIQAALGSGWSVYINTSTTTIAACTKNNEMFLNVGIIHETDWVVSQPSYTPTAPTLTTGFTVVPNSEFTQQYSA